MILRTINCLKIITQTQPRFRSSVFSKVILSNFFYGIISILLTTNYFHDKNLFFDRQQIELSHSTFCSAPSMFVEGKEAKFNEYSCYFGKE